MGTGRVLVIEDEQMVAILLEDVVSIAGGELVGSADNVAMGMALINEKNFDLVILDVNLQGETSEPLAEVLKDIPDVKVIVATGSHPGALPPAYQGFEVAQKPFHMSDIIDMVKSLAF